MTSELAHQQTSWIARLLCFCAPFLAVLLVSCGGSGAKAGEDANVTKLGTLEVTARLIEVPEGAVFQRDLYHYTTILKYEVVEVWRGPLRKGDTILVGHYDPWKPRAEAADDRVKGIGGDLRSFRAGALHRLALETPLDDHYLGGIVDKYFGKRPGPAHWAVWTNSAD